MGFWRTLIGATLVFIVVIIQLFFALGFGVAHIVLYTMFGHYECQSPLGTYLLVAGIVHLVRCGWILCCSTPTYVIERRIQAKSPADRVSGMHQPLVVNLVDSAFSTFLFIWLIVGSVWLWSIDYCSDSLWSSAFIMICIAWALALLTCCCTCAIGVATCCVYCFDSEVAAPPKSGRQVVFEPSRVDYGTATKVVEP